MLFNETFEETNLEKTNTIGIEKVVKSKVTIIFNEIIPKHGIILEYVWLINWISSFAQTEYHIEMVDSSFVFIVIVFILSLFSCYR